VLFGHRIRVRRSQIYEDAFAGLNQLGKGLRGRVQVRGLHQAQGTWFLSDKEVCDQVTFVSEHGTEEAGIDGGGVFKEFIDVLTKRAFDPQYELFRATPDQLLYPNPLSEISHSDHLSHFEFLGRLLGKALYESILVEPQFALFFLQRLAGRLNEVDDLYSLDPEVYRNLMSLKTIKAQGGDVGDLSLNFVVITQDASQQSHVSEQLSGLTRHRCPVAKPAITPGFRSDSRRTKHCRDE
jgi:ubiquitin-protein ligase E3 C